MSFTLLVCGEGAREVAKLSEALLEELSSRGKVAVALSDFDAPLPVVASSPADFSEKLMSLRSEGAAVIALLAAASSVEREAIRASAREAVMVFWACSNQVSTERAHLELRAVADVPSELRRIFEMLEGLGYLPQAGTGISATEDAALVERLKELGYV